MVIDTSLDEEIARYLVEKNEEERKLHEPSGKLSASILGNPVQWQVLKVIGVPSKPIEDYTLRVFERGRHVEDWLVERMNAKNTQVPVEYRGAVGIIDVELDIPHEIKSVKNSKFKRISAQNCPDKSHCLQATFYGKAKKADKVAVDYVAADDYRTLTFILDVAEFGGEVDKAIDEYDEAVARKIVPIFKEKEKWHTMPQYNPYPEWQLLNAEECMKKLKTEYPEAYSKLKGE